VCGGCVHRSRSSVVRADDNQPRSAADHAAVLRHGGPFAHLDAPAAECLHGGKGLVGNVVAHKDRRAAGKRWLRHEVDDGLALNATGFHFRRICRAAVPHRPPRAWRAPACRGTGIRVGRQAVVQGDAHALVSTSRPGWRAPGPERPADGLQGGWCGGGHRSVKEAVLGPMFARQRQARRRQKSVDIGFRRRSRWPAPTQLGVQR
jgi:hypothetical protein